MNACCIPLSIVSGTSIYDIAIRSYLALKYVTVNSTFTLIYGKLTAESSLLAPNHFDAVNMSPFYLSHCRYRSG